MYHKILSYLLLAIYAELVYQALGDLHIKYNFGLSRDIDVPWCDGA